MFIIEKQGLEKQELLAQITAYHAAKKLGIQTQNISLEFTHLEGEQYGNVMSPDGLHFISVNENNGVTKIIETVSHELRHVWQATNGWDFDYSLPYMEQPHEIDAWDFMYKFVDEYKDAIYEEYLTRKNSVDARPDDWENYLIPPPEYYVDYGLSEMVGLSYNKNTNTNKKESIKMTNTFTAKQLNKAGLVASKEIVAVIKEENITTQEGLATLKAELEMDNRGTVRFKYATRCTFDYIIASFVIEKGLADKNNLVELTNAIGNFGKESLKAGKYLLDVDSFIIPVTKKQMEKLIAEASAKASVVTAREAGVPEEQIIKNKEELEAFIGVMNDDTTAIDLNESTVEAPVVIDMPVADESSVTEENKTEKDEVIMTEVKVITVEEHNAILEQFKQQFTAMQDVYENTINQLSEANKAQTAEIEKLTHEQALSIAEVRVELEKTRKELDEITSLRKADARRIEKLNNEMGRARLKLREHKVRDIAENKVLEVPEDETSKLINARIRTAIKIDDAALTIHEKAPEKIAAAAEKTKDGIQWIADKSKDGVDLTARGTNFATEKIANAMTFVAEKIAPTTEQTVESILSIKEDGKKVVTLGGVEYSYDKDGKLIF